MRVAYHAATALMLSITLGGTPMAQDAQESFGCEDNPTGNPIGGGEGYNDIRTSGDYTVTTKEELLAALAQAQPG